MDAPKHLILNPFSSSSQDIRNKLAASQIIGEVSMESHQYVASSMIVELYAQEIPDNSLSTASIAALASTLHAKLFENGGPFDLHGTADDTTSPATDINVNERRILDYVSFH